MDFSELLIKRRSVRHFQDKPVPSGIIHTILAESILAPSAGNEQPWKFIIVSQREMIDRLSEVCKKSMLDRIASNPNDYAHKYEKMLAKENKTKAVNLTKAVWVGISQSGIKKAVASKLHTRPKLKPNKRNKKLFNPLP